MPTTPPVLFEELRKLKLEMPLPPEGATAWECTLAVGAFLLDLRDNHPARHAELVAALRKRGSQCPGDKILITAHSRTLLTTPTAWTR